MPIRLILCLLAAGYALQSSAAGIPDQIDFNRDIRPILSDNCFFCHGPDKATRKADLRLDTKEGLFTPIDNKRPPAVPGHPEQSEIYKRVITEDDDDRMPDPKSGKHLSARDIAVIKKWIEQGAQFKGHWAYIKPTPPALPNLNTQPKALNPVDAFIESRLAQLNLSLSKPADRATLIRRLYFDVVGLPPSPAQVDAFVNDQSPNAYEALVDRMLENPHFGERMAVFWLDLVRYADTIGYHSDNPREIYPYRDWVIKAFNSNMPFDRFTREQLAGDLLPNATLDQKVASAYNRLLQTTEEGGAQPKEYAAKYLSDRVRNVGSVWMAATMGCCECHDHKFDPFTMKDFYSLQAFFADVREAPVGKREPGMPVPNEQQAAELARLDSAVKATQKLLDTQTPELVDAQSKWEGSLADYRVVDWTPLTVSDVSANNGAFPKFGADQIITITRTVPERDSYTVKVKSTLKNITAIRLDVLTDPAKKGAPAGPGRAADGIFILTGISASTSAGAPIVFGSASASAERVEQKLTHTIASALAGTAPGWSTPPGQDHHGVFELKDTIGDGKETILTFTLKFDAGKKHVLNRFKLSATTAPKPVRAIGKELPRDIAQILKTEPARRTPAQKDKLAAYHRSITPLLDDARAQLAKQQKDHDDYLKSVPKVLTTVAQAPATVRILPRGNWNTDSGQVVTPAIPGFLNSLATGNSQPATRLDLANWLVSTDNPLTARVFVNRLWKLYFGTGISKSLEDLGSQGEWPVHPELLDFLACDFQNNGWDIKRTIRLMLTSRTYQQTSYASPQLKEIDPFNRLLARQSRFRLDAEFVRDNALSVAGLLDNRIGGESVKPYQPDGYWDFLNFPKRTYIAAKPPDQYRRGLYTHVQRTFPHTSLTNFDAPSREECTAERARSNTPQQALTLLNDPTYTEAARLFAQRLATAQGSVNERITSAWKTTLGRSPKPEEIEVLASLYANHKQQYSTEKAAATRLLAVGDTAPAKDLDATEVAAWTSVTRTLLNLHETITRN